MRRKKLFSASYSMPRWRGIWARNPGLKLKCSLFQILYKFRSALLPQTLVKHVIPDNLPTLYHFQPTLHYFPPTLYQFQPTLYLTEWIRPTRYLNSISAGPAPGACTSSNDADLPYTSFFTYPIPYILPTLYLIFHLPYTPFPAYPIPHPPPVRGPAL